MRTLLVAAVTSVAIGLTGCSSAPTDQPQPGSLVVGTAQVTVNGADTGTTDAVQCTTAGPLITIETGDEKAGVSALVSNADGLAAKSVAIRNLGGFTGSFEADLQGRATVTQTGRTYDITGSADGFDNDRPSFRTGGTFAIKVAC
jgi:ipoprotein LpqH